MNTPSTRHRAGDRSSSLRSFALVGFVPGSDLRPAALAGARADKGATGLSADQAELAGIGKTLKLRKLDYAVLLGIGLPRLSSYLYGRTAGVPSEIMQRARELLADGGNRQAAREQRFDRRMSEITMEWMRKLGVKADVELAELVGVTSMTIHRWKTDAVKPDMTALVRYDRIVQMLVDKALAKASKVREGRRRAWTGF